MDVSLILFFPPAREACRAGSPELILKLYHKKKKTGRVFCKKIQILAENPFVSIASAEICLDHNILFIHDRAASAFCRYCLAEATANVS
ncbi:hypothetical protein D7X87_15450 [bacterium D16-54]|nr:hypothetical protein D7X87_15450 [bacterium D16-54]RKJ13480.1 hypothetical protein D7X65_15955 [bacterium D16-56]